MHLPESFAATCCQVLRDRRQKLNLSQEDVARRSGLARSYICDVERGARHPSLKNVHILATALEIHTSELIAEVEMNLTAHMDLSSLNDPLPESGLQFEIIKYLNERVSDGVIIANNGGFLFFNDAAERLTGIGKADAGPEAWAEVYGCFKPDRVTIFQTQELPLARAIEGESVDNISMFIRNEKAPEGRYLSITGRPVKGTNDSSPKAGLIMFREINATN